MVPKRGKFSFGFLNVCCSLFCHLVLFSLLSARCAWASERRRKQIHIQVLAPRKCKQLTFLSTCTTSSARLIRNGPENGDNKMASDGNCERKFVFTCRRMNIHTFLPEKQRESRKGRRWGSPWSRVSVFNSHQIEIYKHASHE